MTPAEQGREYIAAARRAELRESAERLPGPLGLNEELAQMREEYRTGLAALEARLDEEILLRRRLSARLDRTEIDWTN